MKKSVFLLLTILILPLFQQTAHASIVFDSSVVENRIITNTVDVIIPQTVPASNVSTDTESGNTKVVSFEGTSQFSGSDVSLNDTAVSMTTTAGGTTDGSTGGSIALSAYTYVDYTDVDGDINAWNTAINPDPVNYMGMVYEDSIVAATISQMVSVSVQQTFTNTGDTDVSLMLNAFLTGLDSIPFASFSSSTGNAGANYAINAASAQVTEMAPEAGSSAQWFIDLLDEDSIEPIIAHPDSDGYSYLFSASIVLTVDITNLDGMGTFGQNETVALEGNLGLGTLALNASLTEVPSAVPVPSSLLLLISGLGGISFIRRRRD